MDFDEGVQIIYEIDSLLDQVISHLGKLRDGNQWNDSLDRALGNALAAKAIVRSPESWPLVKLE